MSRHAQRAHVVQPALAAAGVDLRYLYFVIILDDKYNRNKNPACNDCNGGDVIEDYNGDDYDDKKTKNIANSIAAK